MRTGHPLVTELVTHAGSFHADEVMASAVLMDLFPEARLIRSRDPQLIAPAPGRIVYDVGFEYDPERRIFDHHQPGAPRRGCGTPFSAFGLVWQAHGRDYLAPMVMAEHIEEVFARIDSELVLPVDAIDNGRMEPADAGPFQGVTLFALIEDLHPSWEIQEEAATRAGFDRACRLAAGLIEARVLAISAEIKAAACVRRQVAECRDRPDDAGRIVVLEQSMPWHGPICEPGAEHVLIVIHPRQDGSWVVNTVPVKPGSYDRRMDLPAEWAGLQDADLRTASGIESAIFCHSARFMAVAGTFEDALRMGELAIASNFRNIAVHS